MANGIIDTSIITTQIITEISDTDIIHQSAQSEPGGTITESDLTDLWDDNLTDIWEQDL